MEQRDAATLIAAAVTERGTVWADLGAGSGVFTRALATLVGPGGTVFAVDRNSALLREVARVTRVPAGEAAIHTVEGDFTKPLDLPPLDGVLMANALHYVPYTDQPRVMRQVASLVRAGAPIVVVEYDRDAANQWVPYPIRPALLRELAQGAGLEEPMPLATRPSRFSGTIYSCVVRRA